MLHIQGSQELSILPKPSHVRNHLYPHQGFFLGVFAKTQFVKNPKTQFENTKTQFENAKTQFEN